MFTNNKLGYLAQINGQPAEAASYYQAALQYHPICRNRLTTLASFIWRTCPTTRNRKNTLEVRPAEAGRYGGFVLLHCALSLQGDRDQALEWLSRRWKAIQRLRRPAVYAILYSTCSPILDGSVVEPV